MTLVVRLIDMASGSSIDWAYDSAGIKVVYALELRKSLEIQCKQIS